MAEQQIALRRSFEAASSLSEPATPWRDNLPLAAHGRVEADVGVARSRRLARQQAVAVGWLSLDNAFSSMGEALLLISKESLVDKMSALAPRYLNDGHGWTVRAGKLRHANAKMQRLFEAYCAAIVHDHQPRSLATTASWGEVFWLDLSPAPQTLSPQEARMMLVRMRRKSAFARPDVHKLEALFAITGAEAAVLAGLAAGHSVEEVATLRRASVLTVRKQVASLLSKMECHRQSELVRLASLL